MREQRTQRTFLEEAALNWVPRDRDADQGKAKRVAGDRQMLGARATVGRLP